MDMDELGIRPIPDYDEPCYCGQQSCRYCGTLVSLADEDLTAYGDWTLEPVF